MLKNLTHLVSLTNSTNLSMQMDFNLLIGVLLATSSSAFIGASFIIKKKGLLKVSRNSELRAGRGGYAYLREWLWWVGLIMMALGEAANFTAYAFAPPILVTPLGALSVIVTAILAAYFLNECLNTIGKIGCLLCIVGSVVIILHAPGEGELPNLHTVTTYIFSPLFLIYAISAIIISLVLIIHIAPRYGNTNILVYISICSLIGSLTVVMTKCLSVALRLTIEGDNQFGQLTGWLFLLGMLVTLLTQMNYLNRALDMFNTSIVTPIYYVLFTSLTIIASAIFLREYQLIGLRDWVGIICGFGTIICGIFLLNTFKDLDLSKFKIVITKESLEQKKELLESI
ncbi:Magnesium transporter NIPA2-like isoform X2 [Oopsacas minuta]|uniref:Magnesium transporter NIPA2-like isoform X2 n=1 Tax=Oopsacas minuta TaxID=111878 RepID=A0AAV7JQT1_9METZ|nr:Magnesium transporter NIPA2-like isoform X2 [Oopsacas minuta]